MHAVTSYTPLVLHVTRAFKRPKERYSLPFPALTIDEQHTLMHFNSRDVGMPENNNMRLHCCNQLRGFRGDSWRDTTNMTEMKAGSRKRRRYAALLAHLVQRTPIHRRNGHRRTRESAFSRNRRNSGALTGSRVQSSTHSISAVQPLGSTSTR